MLSSPEPVKQIHRKHDIDCVDLKKAFDAGAPYGRRAKKALFAGVEYSVGKTGLLFMLGLYAFSSLYLYWHFPT